MDELLETRMNEETFNIENLDINYNKYLTFAIENESYCLKIEYVREIIGIQKITQVPNQLEYIKGVINLRGKIIPTMDIRKRFEKKERAYDDRTCIVVINIDDLTVGVVVDRVLEVISLNEKQIYAPKQSNVDVKSKYISGIGEVDNGIIMVLDCEKLIIPEDFDGIGKMLE